MTTTSARLPHALFPTGTSVAVVGPLGPGAVAHRYHSVIRPNPRAGYGQPDKVTVPVPACQPERGTPRASLFSAHWAHVHGATACTHARCFPDAR